MMKAGGWPTARIWGLGATAGSGGTRPVEDDDDGGGDDAEAGVGKEREEEAPRPGEKAREDSGCLKGAAAAAIADSGKATSACWRTGGLAAYGFLRWWGLRASNCSGLRTKPVPRADVPIGIASGGKSARQKLDGWASGMDNARYGSGATGGRRQSPRDDAVEAWAGMAWSNSIGLQPVQPRGTKF